MAGAFEDHLQEIEEDHSVDAEQADAEPGNAAEDFEYLPGQEGGGDGKGEEFTPGFLEIEADAFCEGDAGEREGEEADAAQKWVVDEGCLYKDEVNQTRLGIEAKKVGEEFDLIGNVFVQQAMRAEADDYEEKRIEQLVDRNQEQPPVVPMAL